MEYLLTAAEMADADRYTSEVIGIPSLVLMERAALGAVAAVRGLLPEPGPHARIAVLSGGGNNGADALAAGRMLLDAGYEVRFWLVQRAAGAAAQESVRVTAAERTNPWKGDADQTSPGAAEPAEREETALETQLRILRGYGREAVVFTPEAFSEERPDVIVDGLFGTGLSREVTGVFADAIRLMNEARAERGARIVSVDIPSGIDGTTGQVLGCAVQADVTVTFAFYKRGHFLYPGCTHCGRLILHEIGITKRSLAAEPGMFTFRSGGKDDLLPARSPSGNKGTFGRVLAIAGSKGMSGACTMCAQAVLRSGAGMVKITTHEANRVILQETVPEAMCSTYEDGRPPELTGDLEWADTVLIGPGIGRGADSAALVETVLDYAAQAGRRRFGLVIDADAIRLIADGGLYGKLRCAGLAASVILTPHLAEFASLIRAEIPELQARRTETAREFARLHSCTLMLKDARTLVTSPKTAPLYLNTSGNDGLSTAGSGDVLAGITASFLAQFLRAGEGEDSAFHAACAASYLHGLAAERVGGEVGRRSLCATDLIPVLQEL